MDLKLFYKMESRFSPSGKVIILRQVRKLTSRISFRKYLNGSFLRGDHLQPLN